jgi:hypothetical protein
MVRRLLPALLLIAVACSDGDDDTLNQIEALEVQICDLVANQSCAAVDSCAYIGFGSKPCGGPWEQLVYCATNVDEAQLESLIAQHATLEEQYNIDNQIASDCSVPNDPVLELVGGDCADSANTAYICAGSP